MFGKKKVNFGIVLTGWIVLLYIGLIRAETGIWDYFLLPEGTRKEWAGGAVVVYSEVEKDNFGNIFVTTKEDSFAEEISVTEKIYYKLVPDTKQILEIGRWNSVEKIEDMYEHMPLVILDLPLKVGKKWHYNRAPSERSRRFSRRFGLKDESPTSVTREVTKKKMLKLPAGTFEVYVIKISIGQPGKVNIYYTYWAKGVGLVAAGSYSKYNKPPGWGWSRRLVKITKPQKAVKDRGDTHRIEQEFPGALEDTGKTIILE